MLEAKDQLKNAKQKNKKQSNIIITALQHIFIICYLVVAVAFFVDNLILTNRHCQYCHLFHSISIHAQASQFLDYKKIET